MYPESLSSTPAVSGAGEHSLIVPGPFYETLPGRLADRPCYMVIDRNVETLYRERLPDCPRLALDAEEAVKTLGTVERLDRRFMEWNVDRHSLVLVIGGGVVCDITGFAAATYMRGVPFGFVPTTLLAMVDAAHGGKNGVNLERYKNLVGTFAEPEFILLDFQFLRTLTQRDYGCGLAEMVKIAAVTDEGLFGRMEQQPASLLQADDAILKSSVYRAIQAKLDIVGGDFREHDSRKLLNFGHTLGHAIERLTGLPHGEAVAVGMVYEADLAVRLGLSENCVAQRLEQLCQALRLPTRLELDPLALCDNLEKDKKRKGSGVELVVLPRIGTATLRYLSYSQLRALMQAS